MSILSQWGEKELLIMRVLGHMSNIYVALEENKVERSPLPLYYILVHINGRIFSWRHHRGRPSIARMHLEPLILFMISMDYLELCLYSP
jgi:hypothetical protein